MAFNIGSAPPWPSEFVRAKAIASVAKTTYNDIVNAVELLRYDLVAAGGPCGGTKGGLIKRLSAMPRGSITAAVQLMILSSLDGAQTFDLKASAVMGIYTFAATTAIPSTIFTTPDGAAVSETNPLRLGPAERLWFGIATAQTAGVVCELEGDGYA